jgi:hypothetical protein
LAHEKPLEFQEEGSLGNVRVTMQQPFQGERAGGGVASDLTNASAQIAFFVCAGLLAGCASQNPTPETPAVESPTISLVKTLRERWQQCLRSSFATTKQQTPDKNAAAEMAFRACATEESALMSFASRSGASPDLLIAAKLRMKQELTNLP